MGIGDLIRSVPRCDTLIVQRRARPPALADFSTAKGSCPRYCERWGGSGGKSAFYVSSSANACKKKKLPFVNNKTKRMSDRYCKLELSEAEKDPEAIRDRALNLLIVKHAAMREDVLTGGSSAGRRSSGNVH